MFSGLQKLQLITARCNGMASMVKGRIDCDYNITVFSIDSAHENSPCFLDHEIDRESCVCESSTLSPKNCNFVIAGKLPRSLAGGVGEARARYCGNNAAQVRGGQGGWWVGAVIMIIGSRVICGSGRRLNGDNFRVTPDKSYYRK